MFKNTTQFFRKVYNDIVPKIDQDNYVRLITDNHNLEKLKTLYFDLEIYISDQIENLEGNIHSEQIQIKIEEYKKIDKEVPYKTIKNIKYEIAQRKNLPLDGISETIKILDLDTMFYGLEMYPIRKLKNEIGLLIRNLKKQELEKESVFTTKSNSPQQHETIKDDGSNQLHPNFNPNLWNRDCFELFKYLFDNYYSKTKRQLINIWFYLNENGIDKYNLKASKDAYKVFILEHYKVRITNDEKAKFKYEDKEFSTLQDHRISFENSLK